LGDNFIGGQKDQTFDLRLRKQHAVKRVLMDRRQILGCHGMLAQDGEFAPAIVDEPAP
jgi:hypothetical protein